MVSLRLSSEEFERYRSASVALGMRNLSEFARMAMNRVITTPAERDIEILAQIEELRKRLAEVATGLDSVRQRIPPVEGQAASANESPNLSPPLRDELLEH